MISAVIFDLDRPLADTEPLHCRAYQISLSEHGIGLSEADYCEHPLPSGKCIVDWVSTHGLALDLHAVRAKKSEY
jgi:beta-phosphoglucomutase-like phosphatase (HAD superfamily)